MTLVSQIITDAYRQGNLVPIGLVPTAEQSAEALRYLNRIVQSSLGSEIGEPLIALPVGNEGYSRPSGYPPVDFIGDSEWFVPGNTRLMLNLSSPTSVYLTPNPEDGARFGVVDDLNNLATNPLTIYGNGHRIAGGTSALLNDNGFYGDWMYRADLGQWLRALPLNPSDEFPLPAEFDDYYITLLAIRLNPAIAPVETDPPVTETGGSRTASA